MTLEKKKLFNPDADTSLSKRKLIGGESTNLMELSDNKYEWSFKLYRTMMQNFWIPESVSLGQDYVHYDSHLTTHEKEAFEKTISFLVFLDSLQTVNLPNINDYVTLPEVNLLLNIQTYQEALHSQSYGYIIESVIPSEQRKRIYDIAITNPFLLKRNKYIVDLYQEFIDCQSEQGFAKVMMANYILEGTYFYSSFAFFYNLARNGKMTGVSSEIVYINRDELTHLVLFQNMFKELRKENPLIFTPAFEDSLRQMMREAVQNEIDWFTYCIGDKISGLSISLMDSYLKYLSNFRLKNINLAPLYPEIDKDPLPFIQQFTKFNQTKVDFFEEHVRNYAKDAGNLGLDELDNVEF